MANIDSLEIEVKATATKAIAALDALSDRLNKVGGALNQLNTTGLNNLASGVEELTTSMKGFKDINKSAFTSLAKNLNKLTTVDFGKLNNGGNSIIELVNAMELVGKASQQIDSATPGITNLAKAIRSLGSKNVGVAIQNIPALTNGLTKMVTELSEVPNVSESTIRSLEAIANATNSMRGAAKNYTKGTREINKANKGLVFGFANIAQKMGLFYASFGYVIRAFKQMWSVIGDAMNYVETYNYFNVITSKIETEFADAGTESANQFTNSFRKQMSALTEKMTGYSIGKNGELVNMGSIGLGVNANDVMAFQTKIASITNSVGMLGEQSVITSNALTMLATDLSSLTNKDVSEVMDNLSSGLIGMSRSLYRYGIDITDTMLEQYALANGIDKAVSEMTQQEKMQLRLIAILDQSKVAWGDQANTIDSVANQYRVFKNQAENLGRTLGNIFLPIVKNVLPYVNGLTIAVNNLLTVLGTTLWGNSWLADLNDGISSGYVDTGLEDIGNAADNATDSVEKLNKSIRGFDELNVISTNKSSTENVADTIDLTNVMSKYLASYESKWDEAFSGMQNKAEELARVFTEDLHLETIAEGLGKVGSALGEFAEAMTPFVAGFGEGFINFFNVLGGVAFKVIGEGIKLVAESLNMVEPDIWKVAGEALGTIAAALVTINAINGIATLFTTLSTGLSTIGTGVTAAVAANPYLLTLLVALGAIAAIITTIKEREERIKSGLPTIGSEMSSLLSEMLGKTSETAAQMTTLAQTLDDVAKDGDVTKLFEKWNKLNENFENLTDPEKDALKEYSEQLKEKVGGLNGLIDENGRAYEGVYEQIKACVLEQEKLNDLAAYSGLKSEYKKVAMEATINKTDAENEIEELVKEFAKEFNLKDEVAKGFLKTISDNGISKTELLTWAKTGIRVGGMTNVDQEFINQLVDLFGGSSGLKNIFKREQVASNLYDFINPYNKANETVKEFDKQIEEATNKLGIIDQKIANINTTTIEPTVDATEINSVSETLNALDGKKIEIDFIPKFNTSNLLKFGSPQYATGGFPEDGFFFANHSELVGKFSNGKTVVANNMQIIEGIKQGVYEAMVSAGGNNNVTVVLEGDANTFFKAMQKEAYNYNQRTGRMAFD